LVLSLQRLRGLLRQSITVDSDLEAARSALKPIVQFFVTLEDVASRSKVTAISLLEVGRKHMALAS
jgi:hypothetical protein